MGVFFPSSKKKENEDSKDENVNISKEIGIELMNEFNNKAEEMNENDLLNYDENCENYDDEEIEGDNYDNNKNVGPKDSLVAEEEKAAAEEEEEEEEEEENENFTLKEEEIQGLVDRLNSSKGSLLINQKKFENMTNDMLKNVAEEYVEDFKSCDSTNVTGFSKAALFLLQQASEEHVNDLLQNMVRRGKETLLSAHVLDDDFPLTIPRAGKLETVFPGTSNTGNIYWDTIFERAEEDDLLDTDIKSHDN
eukprot:Awhi_evm1s14815